MRVGDVIIWYPWQQLGLGHSLALECSGVLCLLVTAQSQSACRQTGFIFPALEGCILLHHYALI